VVADLDQKRPIWLGGQGRTEKDMDLFYEVMEKNAAHRSNGGYGYVETVSQSTQENAPNAGLFMTNSHHETSVRCLDEVRRSEYKSQREG